MLGGEVLVEVGGVAPLLDGDEGAGGGQRTPTGRRTGSPPRRGSGPTRACRASRTASSDPGLAVMTATTWMLMGPPVVGGAEPSGSGEHGLGRVVAAEAADRAAAAGAGAAEQHRVEVGGHAPPLGRGVEGRRGWGPRASRGRRGRCGRRAWRGRPRRPAAPSPPGTGRPSGPTSTQSISGSSRCTSTAASARRTASSRGAARSASKSGVGHVQRRSRSACARPGRPGRRGSRGRSASGSRTRPGGDDGSAPAAASA